MQELSKKEIYDLKKHQKSDTQKQTQRIGRARRFLKIGIFAILLAAGLAAFIFFIISKNPGAETGNIISSSGIHWHPELSIYINGQKQEIPASIGLGVQEEPVHTHDEMGVIHLEFQGVVTKEDVKLGKFFRIWKKEFNSTCIFTFCNGPNGKVSFSVNGEENNEFENYIMRNGDKMEIRYE